MKEETSVESKFSISPIKHLFLSNDAPTDSELVQITKLIRDIETHISELATQSNTGFNPLFQTHLLSSLLISLKHAISPVRRLPSEIISDIFLHCLPYYYGRPWTKLEDKEPWKFGRVSRRWRAIALGDSRLWSNVDVWAGTRMVNIMGLSTCLVRSGQHPLSVKLTGDPFFLRQLLPHTNRCAFMEFHLGTHDFDCLKTIKGPLPELCELYIYTNFPDFWRAPEWTCNAFEIVPKMQKALIYMEQWIDPKEFKFPWHQLKSLKTDTIQILSHCHQLVDCAISIPLKSVNRYLAYHYPKITLRNLETLCITSTKLLSALILPSLNSLSISEFWINQSDCFNEIRLLMSNSLCALKRLDFGGATFQPGSDLRQLLAECEYPSLLTVILPKPTLNVVFDQDIPLPGGWRLESGNPRDKSRKMVFRRDSQTVT